MADSIQNVKIKFTSDTTGLVTANKELQNLTAQEAAAVKGFESLNKAAVTAGASIQRGAATGQAETSKSIGLINTLTNNIKTLQTARDKSNDPTKIRLLNNELDKQNAQLKKLTTSTSELGKKAEGLGSTFKSVAGYIGAAFSIGAVIGFGKQIFAVTSEFEKLRAVLTNTLGSQSLADTALGKIKKLAVETNFSVLELTNAYVKLANSGFEPTVVQLRALADLTNSTGKTFDQLAEAILDANTDQFIRLKEFGIKASREGDKISFLFKGVRTEVDRNSASITNYLVGLGKLPGVMGATAAISQTLSGKFSNLGDAYDQFLDILGSSKSGFIKDVIQGLTNLLTVVGEFARTAEQTREAIIGQNTLEAVENLTQVQVVNLELIRKQFGKNSQEEADFIKQSKENYILKHEQEIEYLLGLKATHAQLLKNKEAIAKESIGTFDRVITSTEKKKIDFNQSEIDTIEAKIDKARIAANAFEQSIHDIEVAEKQANLAASETARLKEEAFAKGRAAREKAFNDAKSELDQAEKNAIRYANINGKSLEYIVRINQDFNNKRLKLYEETNHDIIRIEKDGTKVLFADYEDLIIREIEQERGLTAAIDGEILDRLMKVAAQEKAKIDAIDESLARRLTKQSEHENALLLIQADYLKAGVIDMEEYEKAVKKIKQDSEIQQIKDNITAGNAKLKTTALNTKERLDIEADLEAQKKALLDIGVENLKDAEKEKTEALKKENEEKKKLDDELKKKRDAIMQESFKLAMDITSALFDLSKRKINDAINTLKGQEKEELRALKEKGDEEQIINDKKRGKELMAVEGDKVATKAINDKFKQQAKEDLIREKRKEQEIKDKYTKLELDLKIKAAKQDKAQAIFGALVNAPVAVIKAFKDGGPILAALVAAAVALQIGLISSRPLPKFFDGTDYAELNGNPRGRDTIPAMIHEGERIVPTSINKHLEGIPNTELPKLAEMYHRKLDYQGITNVINGRSGGSQDLALITEVKAMNKKLDSLKVANIMIDKHGIKTFVTTKNSETEFVNNYFRN